MEITVDSTGRLMKFVKVILIYDLMIYDLLIYFFIAPTMSPALMALA